MNTKGVEDGMVCEFCGTHCYQGAEHNARVEDNARFNDPQERTAGEFPHELICPCYAFMGCSRECISCICSVEDRTATPPPITAFCPKCQMMLINTTAGLPACPICHGPVTAQPIPEERTAVAWMYRKYLNIGGPRESWGLSEPRVTTDLEKTQEHPSGYGKWPITEIQPLYLRPQPATPIEGATTIYPELCRDLTTTLANRNREIAKLKEELAMREVDAIVMPQSESDKVKFNSGQECFLEGNHEAPPYPGADTWADMMTNQGWVYEKRKAEMQAAPIPEERTAEMEELGPAIIEAVGALRSSYNVQDFPGDGDTRQDHAANALERIWDHIEGKVSR